MQLSCDFINSVVVGNYDEMGFVNLNENGSRHNSERQGKSFVQEVTPVQVFGLCASLALCGVLAGWSYALNRSLQKDKPWKPRGGFNVMSLAKNETTDITRQNSGIVTGRSRSGGSYYMT